MKEPSTLEVVGDINNNIVNFYQTCKDSELFPFLQKMVDATPYARELRQEARLVRRNSDVFSALKRAWAVWVLATLSFSANLGSGFSYDRKNNLVGKRFNNRKRDFGPRIMKRLENVCIENMDVLELIKSRDSEDTFFYVDPPYISESMGSKT